MPIINVVQTKNSLTYKITGVIARLGIDDGWSDWLFNQGDF